MKIALLGYGRMGKIIERVAVDRGHCITLKADSKTIWLVLSWHCDRNHSTVGC